MIESAKELRTKLQPQAGSQLKEKAELDLQARAASSRKGTSKRQLGLGRRAGPESQLSVTRLTLVKACKMPLTILQSNSRGSSRMILRAI